MLAAGVPGYPMPVNPYESPQIPADEGQEDGDPPVAWPATGAFRYYQTLVWHTRSPLPRICVRTGLPADSTTTLNLRPLIDDDGTIAPAFDLRPQLYEVVVPIHAAGYQAHDWRQLGLYCLLAGFICAAMAAFWPGTTFTGAPFDVLGVVLFGVAAVILLAAGIRWVAGPMRIQLLCVDRTYLQLFGLHPAFLEALPEWPVPDRDSARRRSE